MGANGKRFGPPHRQGRATINGRHLVGQMSEQFVELVPGVRLDIGARLAARPAQWAAWLAGRSSGTTKSASILERQRSGVQIQLARPVCARRL